MTDQEQLFRKLILDLQKVSFALVELQLYLDTHEGDEHAIQDFNRLTEMQLMLKHRYERDFGPLTQYGYSPVEHPKGWIENPWPWEL